MDSFTFSSCNQPLYLYWFAVLPPELFRLSILFLFNTFTCVLHNSPAPPLPPVQGLLKNLPPPVRGVAASWNSFLLEGLEAF